MKEESDIQIELSRIISALQSIDGILADPIGKWASLTAAEKELYGNSAASWWQLERIMLHNKANHLRTQQTGLLGLLSSLMEARKVVEADDPIDQLRITNFVSANVTHIPEYHELQSLITRPLKKPFPVSIADYNAVLTSPDVKDLIMESSSTYSKQFMLKIWYPIVSPPTTGDSEDSFHVLWDLLIVEVLKFALTNSSTFQQNRNSKKFTETGNNRPDLSLVVKDYCVFRGEEKGPTTNGNPERELTEKLIWSYGSLPYIFGYYAYGYNIRLCILECKKQSGAVTRRDFGDNYDIRHPTDRCRLVTALLNLAPILGKLAELAPSSNALPDVVFTRPTKTVSLCGNLVYKGFYEPSVFHRVRRIYRLIEPKAPNLEYAFTISESEMMLVCKPRIEMTNPSTPKQLCQCLIDISVALKYLHSKQIVHHDVRWDNIGLLNGTWYLIDFDEASDTLYDILGRDNLAFESHSPEVRSAHDCRVDIWSLGHLISTAFTDVTEFKALSNACCQTDPNLRWSLTDVEAWLRSLALQHEWN